MLQPVGVLAIAPVLGPARRLHIGGLPRLGAERAQRRRRVERAGADLHVVGLQDDAALLRPETLQRQDQTLERAFRLEGVGHFGTFCGEAFWRTFAKARHPRSGPGMGQGWGQPRATNGSD